LKNQNESIACRKGERESDKVFLLSIQQVLEDKTIAEITPAIARRVAARLRQARREHETHLAENGLGPCGIVLPRPAKQLTANERGF
jgi:hypothetical protein